MEIDGIHQYLELALGLHKGSHDAERTNSLSIPGQKTGNNRMIGFFPRPDTIITTWIHTEIIATVTECHTVSRDDNT